jgi:hypothetical protein
MQSGTAKLDATFASQFLQVDFSHPTTRKLNSHLADMQLLRMFDVRPARLWEPQLASRLLRPETLIDKPTSHPFLWREHLSIGGVDMTKSLKLLTGSFLLASIVLFARTVQARPQASSKVPITTVVTVLGPSFTAPPVLGKEDVVVYTGKTREDVAGWVPAQGDRGKLELAIVIDDATNVGNQLVDLRNFIRSQSPATAVGVFYATNGVVQAAAQFSTDHESAAKAIRITIGYAGASTSIYLSLMDLISRWPLNGSRHEMLVIADGIDRFRGDPASPDVTSTIPIHTLYARGVGREGRSLFRVNYGQSNLGQMADGTGGESFFQGLDTPISFAPFLSQLDMVLHNQYFLTFMTARSTRKKGEFRRFRVRTEQHNVEISAADAVFVPGP